MNLFRIREKETTAKRIELDSASFEKVSLMYSRLETNSLYTQE